MRIIAILSRKRNSPVPSLEEKPYTLGGHNLAMVPAQKDLGITVTNKLSCSPQISTIVAKANIMHGFLCKHCSTYIGTNQKTLLYLTFVRSHLSYPSEIWAPQSRVSDLRLLEHLEGIQRRATRAILGCNSDPNHRPSNKSRLISLNLLPILHWLDCRDLFFFYKSLHGAYNFSLNNFISFATGNTRSATNLNLRSKSFRTSLFRDSFFNRIVPLWNNLPVLIKPKIFHDVIYS